MAKVAQIKTKVTEQSADAFIAALPDAQKRADSLALLQLMQEASGAAPRMWGASIVGFGEKRYKSPASGREVDWFLVGFAARKANLSLYLTMNVQEHAALLARLGKHKTGVGCLYINKLADIDTAVLEELIRVSLAGK